MTETTDERDERRGRALLDNAPDALWGVNVLALAQAIAKDDKEAGIMFQCEASTRSITKVVNEIEDAQITGVFRKLEVTPQVATILQMISADLIAAAQEEG